MNVVMAMEYTVEEVWVGMAIKQPKEKSSVPITERLAGSDDISRIILFNTNTSTNSPCQR
jgi:hypothetical protein